MTLPTRATAKSRADFAVAERIAAFLSRDSDVAAIAVGGSVARGIANPISDLDVFVYCLRFPAERTRRALVESLGGTHWRTHSGTEDQGLVRECFVAGGARVDLDLLLVPTVEACLRAVLEKHNLTPHIQAFVGGFVDAISLHGHELHETWRARAAAYPPELGRKQVAANLFVEPLWTAENSATACGERLRFLESLCRVENAVLSILVGLNHLYRPSEWKRLRRLIEGMPLAPANLAERLERALTADVREAARELSAVVSETFDLVERHLPDLDVARARAHFTSDPALADYPAHPAPS
jgi:hypothetical protein